MRLDQLLTQKNLVESREKAKAAIMAGLVYVDGQKVTKPGTNVSEDAQVEVKGPAVPYVSRGGLKLEKALEVFNIDPTGLVAVDVGASTGDLPIVFCSGSCSCVCYRCGLWPA